MLYIAVEVKEVYRCKNTTRTPHSGTASVNYKGKYEKSLKVGKQIIWNQHPEAHSEFLYVPLCMWMCIFA